MLKRLLSLTVAAGLLWAFLAPGLSWGGEGVLETRTLPNGIRVVVVHFPGSGNATLFTFVPMGMSSDGPGQAQWSHLIEHLVIRSTISDDLSQANAETAPDHMRLDFYGNADNWKEGLAHHKRWLEGAAFTAASLEAEKPKVVAECDFTARNFATHKFALAAWAQGFRHGVRRVELKGNVLRAELKNVQRVRDERFAVLDKTTVCLVGGVDAKTFFAEAERELGGIGSQAKLAPAAKTQAGKLDLVWDLDARHLVLTWPIPGPGRDGYAGLMAAVQWLNMQFFTDAELKSQTGMVFAGADLSTPEGGFLYVSASLRPHAEFAAVEKRVRAQVNRLAVEAHDRIPMFARQLASALTRIPDPAVVQAQAPPGMSPALVEANAGLTICTNAYRLGEGREALAGELARISAVEVQQAAAKHLTEQTCCVCTLHPASGTEKR